MSISIETLKETHTPGIKGLWKIYKKKKAKRVILFPLLFSLVFISIFISFQIDAFPIIEKVIDVVFTVNPALLGFVLGGYAIIIGFGSEKLLRKTAKISEEEPISYYQTFSSNFAICIYAITINLIITTIFYFITLIDLPFYVFKWIIDSINYFALFLLVFSTMVAVVLIPFMVINIFNFSQTHHLTLVLSNENEEPDEDKK